MLGSPSKTRRLTRGSERRRHADEQEESTSGEITVCGDQPAHQNDGLSSASEPETGTESESEGAQLSMPELAGSSDCTTDECTEDEAEAVGVVLNVEPSDDASRRLAWQLAAQEAGVCLVVPESSADEASQDEAGLRSETDYESALSVDEDQETVVNVDTRETIKQKVHSVVPKVSKSAEQVSRAHGALGAMQSSLSARTRAMPVLERQAAITRENDGCAPAEEPNTSEVRPSRANSQTNLHVEAEAARVECCKWFWVG